MREEKNEMFRQEKMRKDRMTQKMEIRLEKKLGDLIKKKKDERRENKKTTYDREQQSEKKVR